MKTQRVAILILAASLSGCLPDEGTFLPACVAYAGDKITLTDGQFTWEKFTDERVIGDDGEIVDPFPGYPLQGSFRIDRRTLHLESASGEQLPTMHLHKHEGHRYLLTDDEFAALQGNGRPADCALRLMAESGS